MDIRGSQRMTPHHVHTWGSHRWPAGVIRSSWRCCGWLWLPGSASWSRRWRLPTQQSSPPWSPGSERWRAGGGSSLDNKGGGEKRLPVPLNTYCTCRSWSEEVNQTNICNKQPGSLLIRPKHSDFCKACPFNVLKCKKVSVLPRVVDEGNNIHCKLPAVVTADVFCPHSILWHFHWSKWDQTNEIGFQF